MPVNLLDVLLSLMHEEQLGRDVDLHATFTGDGGLLVLVLLDREVPEGHLVV